MADFIASDTAVQAFMATLSEEQVAAFIRCIDESSFGGMLAWVYGSGFPKSHDIAKAIDKAAGDVRPVVGHETTTNDIRGGALLDAAHGGHRPAFERAVTSAASAASAAWEGWGTALKPAFEPMCVARKPLEGTNAENVLKHGVGALNIDGCRIEGAGNKTFERIAGDRPRDQYRTGTAAPGSQRPNDLGRWPANVVHDGSDEVLAAFPGAPGAPGAIRAVTGEERAHRTVNTFNDIGASRAGMEPRGDAGSAARFFYSSKADAEDRLGSKHPTVKPVALMRWLVRLVTPPGGLVLDPFAGSGTTAMACLAEGFDCVLVEREAEYVADIRRRIAHVSGQDTPLFTQAGE